MCDAGLEKKLAEIASKRSMEDLTVGPVLTWSTEAMLGHVDKLLNIPGTAPLSSQPPLPQELPRVIYSQMDGLGQGWCVLATPGVKITAHDKH